ncbi:LysM peptidoglycan-binding domain-containing protein [Gynuella sunshinyii]|uniref:LysM domain-containing protein n=1 Tax=Gynuella sunshinyii YC6258 TaxID=1445510 RepID=A0A0C5W5Q1_9GAMM|nr:LysM peptidoglycan-binding domain-containing protein [Gynuella sunshinyii]AJQ97934.1 hypothetical Protein YC6258_05910 [Gynuella sunshinyii YC6258]
MKVHMVRQGECLTTIAAEFGLTPEEIWNLPDNQDLSNKRRHSGCLAPGDQLVIPNQASQGKDIAINDLTVLVIADNQYLLQLTLLDNTLNPIKNLEVRCTWPNCKRYISGITNGQGIVRLTLPNLCDKGILAWEYQQRQWIRGFDVGTLLPEELTTGMDQRLTNLTGSLGHYSDQFITAWADEAGQSPDQLEQQLTGQA